MSKKVELYRRAEDALFNSYRLKREEHFIPVKNLGPGLRVQTVGEGQPILFIHGGPNGGSAWAGLLPALGGYKSLLLDRPGCGLSDAVAIKNLSMSGFRNQILSTLDAVIDYFQCKTVSLVGSSLGGYWALQYVLQRSARVEKLVLEGCPALVEGMVVPQFLRTMTTPVLRWLLPKLPASYSYIKQTMKDLGHADSIEKGKLSEAYIRWYVSLTNHTATMKNDLALIHKALFGGRVNPEYVLPDSEIEKVACPTLWLWGAADPFGGPEIGRRLQAKMDRSKFVSFTGGGHLPWLDDPAAHGEKIKEFLAE